MTDERRKQRLRSDTGILEFFSNWEVDSSTREYLQFHVHRYVYLLDKVAALSHSRILDIGSSFQTALLREIYIDSVVDTLGFDDTRFRGRPGKDRHIGLDLNDAADPTLWPAAEEPYDLVLMAEVLEHLYTAARPVLQCVASFVAPGGRLILQTPNAVNLGRRLSTLRGKNPFGMIREERNNPGHFCEFTIEDLSKATEKAGLVIESATLTNYFGERGVRKTIYEALCTSLPGNLRDGITLIARRP